MIPDAKSIQAQRIELTNMTTCGAERVPKGLRQLDRVHRVNPDMHVRAVLLRPDQRLQESHSEQARRPSVNFQANRNSGGFDCFKHRRKNLPPGTKPITALS